MTSEAYQDVPAVSPADPNRPNYRYRPLSDGDEPVVSVITPFYNVGDVFDETVLSVMRQTL